MVARLRLILADLDAAEKNQDLNLPGYRLHRLKGDLKGFWAIDVTGNWRVVFRLDAGDVYDVDLIDYHPGEHVRANCLEPLGLSITAAAKALGVARKTLSELVNGKSGISPEMAIRLEKAFGSSARHWMQLQLNYDLWQAEQRASDLHVERLQPA
jgi:addiction module HigA family antidote